MKTVLRSQTLYARSNVQRLVPQLDGEEYEPDRIVLKGILHIIVLWKIGAQNFKITVIRRLRTIDPNQDKNLIFTEIWHKRMSFSFRTCSSKDI